MSREDEFFSYSSRCVCELFLEKQPRADALEHIDLFKQFDDNE